MKLINSGENLVPESAHEVEARQEGPARGSNGRPAATKAPPIAGFLVDKLLFDLNLTVVGLSAVGCGGGGQRPPRARPAGAATPPVRGLGIRAAGRDDRAAGGVRQRTTAAAAAPQVALLGRLAAAARQPRPLARVQQLAARSGAARGDARRAVAVGGLGAGLRRRATPLISVDKQRLRDGHGDS